jgi:hypothetical protein
MLIIRNVKKEKLKLRNRKKSEIKDGDKEGGEDKKRYRNQRKKIKLCTDHYLCVVVC